MQRPAHRISKNSNSRLVGHLYNGGERIYFAKRPNRFGSKNVTTCLSDVGFAASSRLSGLSRIFVIDFSYF
jgi:hypothetical protein